MVYSSLSLSRARAYSSCLKYIFVAGIAHVYVELHKGKQPLFVCLFVFFFFVKINKQQELLCL
jgi:ABC-type amino acid transport system permease subunit